jgi:hypothetical protein
MTIRKAATVLSILCAAALAAPVAASAQTTTTRGTSFKNVPVSGTAHNGKAFTGHFTVTQFVTRGGKTVAVGTLTGKLGNHNIKSTQMALPAAVSHATGAAAAAACPILHLTLGPLDLNLLGLKVHLNQVILDITAQSGPGNLLGNLLCSVSNLLNGPTVLNQELAGLLNIVQQLANTPALLNL